MPDFTRALELARASAEFRETGSGDARRYRARFWSGDAAKLRDLFQIVGASDATEVLIDDRPVPFARELWLPLGLVSDSAVTTVAKSSLDQDLHAARIRAETARGRIQHVFRRPVAQTAVGNPRARRGTVKQFDRMYIQNTGDRFRFQLDSIALRRLHRSLGQGVARP